MAHGFLVLTREPYFAEKVIRPETDHRRTSAMKFSRATASYDRDDILGRAETYRSRGRIRKAIREYEKILAMDPRDMHVHTRVAPLYIRMGRKDRAKDSLRQVIAGYEKQGFTEKAIAMLRLALTVDRHDLAMHLHLADLHLANTHAGNARNILDAARKAFRSKKYRSEALAVEEKILRLAPDDFPTQVSIVRLLWKSRKKREALDRLRQMEEQWARRGNRPNWRKTRRLLCRYSPSLPSAWGYFVSLFPNHLC
jgi:pilus assembly protein FimV